MIHFFIGLFGWPVYIAICMVYNYIKIEKWKIKPRYFVSNTWRFFFGFVALILMTVHEGFDPAYLSTWETAKIPSLYIGSSFYLFFDPGLNWLRGKRWNYRGKSSGWLDRSKIVFYYTLKVCCLAGFIYSLIRLI